MGSGFPFVNRKYLEVKLEKLLTWNYYPKNQICKSSLAL